MAGYCRLEPRSCPSPTTCGLPSGWRFEQARVIYVWTHDSIALGEDGPTHQPVEQLAGLRAMPNMMVIRPSDATETVEAWRVALQHIEGPVGLVLTRQKAASAGPQNTRPGRWYSCRSIYSRRDAGIRPRRILIATGSEVSLALEAHQLLVKEGIRSRVVSMPCWELFDAQPQTYRDAVLPPSVHARVSIEAAAPFGWERYVGPGGRDHWREPLRCFSSWAGGMRESAFTPKHVRRTAKAVLGKKKSV